MGMIDQLAGIAAAPTQDNPFAMTAEARADLELNDSGNARRLLSVYGPDLLFNYGKKWGVWDGNRYSFQSGPLKAAEIAARLPDLVQEEIAAVKARQFDEFTLNRKMQEEGRKRGGKRYVDLEDVAEDLKAEMIKRLSAHRIKCGNVAMQEKALKAAEWQVRAEIEDMDSDPWKFVVKNGVVDLRRVAETPGLGQEGAPTDLAEWRESWLLPPQRGIKPTKCAGTVFNPAATCPEWEKFIELILPNWEIRYCLQRCLGALLFGANVAQVAILLRGSGGNGKSTLMSIVGEVLGNRDGYAVPARVEMFLQTQNESPGKPTPEEVDLPGARCLLASEPAVTDVFSAKKIKALTGGDLRTARALNAPQFTYRPTAIPVIQFNRTPRIKDEDDGTRRRLVFVPLDVNLRELPPELRRSPLEVERALRRELPGILNWMLDGFRDFQARLEDGVGTPPGIDPPQIMQDLKSRIMEAADPVGSFLRECTDIDQDGRTGTQDFFRAFKAWAKDNGARVFSDAALRDNLIEKGFEKGKSNGRMVFKGFKMKDDPLVQQYLEDLAGFAPPQGGGYSDDDFR